MSKWVKLLDVLPIKLKTETAVDLNSDLDTGFYGLYADSKNGPSGVNLNGAMLFHFRWDMNTAEQIIMAPLSNLMYYRMKRSDLGQLAWATLARQ